MVEGTAWLNSGLLTSCLDRNQERGHVYTKRIKTNPRSAVLRNITDKADELARLYNKTKDPKYKEEWYKILKEIPIDNNYNYPI